MWTKEPCWTTIYRRLNEKNLNAHNREHQMCQILCWYNSANGWKCECRLVNMISQIDKRTRTIMKKYVPWFLFGDLTSFKTLHKQHKVNYSTPTLSNIWMWYKKIETGLLLKESEPNFFPLFNMIWSDHRNQPFN